jgi:hypothetical protein
MGAQKACLYEKDEQGKGHVPLSDHTLVLYLKHQFLHSIHIDL